MHLFSVRSNPAIAAMGILCMLVAPAAAAAQLDATAERFHFDIPAQPLSDALRRYASLTHQPTLFRSDLIRGRRSTAVHGVYSSEVALHRLLDGTGLTAEKSEAGGRVGFVLKVVDPSVVAPRASLGSLAGYPGLIQARVLAALCADPQTVPGAYRSLLRFQVDATGQIQRPRLLSSTGDTQRDAAILAALLRVRMEGPPPPDLQQPVTMLITPREVENADGPDCHDGAP